MNRPSVTMQLYFYWTRIHVNLFLVLFGFSGTNAVDGCLSGMCKIYSPVDIFLLVFRGRFLVIIRVLQFIGYEGKDEGRSPIFLMSRVARKIWENNNFYICI